MHARVSGLGRDAGDFDRPAREVAMRPRVRAWLCLSGSVAICTVVGVGVWWHSETSPTTVDLVTRQITPFKRLQMASETTGAIDGPIGMDVDATFGLPAINFTATLSWTWKIIDVPTPLRWCNQCRTILDAYSNTFAFHARPASIDEANAFLMSVPWDDSELNSFYGYLLQHIRSSGRYVNPDSLLSSWGE